MATAIRLILGALAGLLVTLVLVMAVEMFSSVVHPFPPDLEMNQETICDHVAAYPSWVLAVVVGLWGGTAFLGVWVAGKVGHPLAAIVTGGLVLWGLAFNLYMLPYPLWFKVVMPTAALMAIALAIATTKGRGIRAMRQATPDS